MFDFNAMEVHHYLKDTQIKRSKQYSMRIINLSSKNILDFVRKSH